MLLARGILGRRNTQAEKVEEEDRRDLTGINELLTKDVRNPLGSRRFLRYGTKGLCSSCSADGGGKDSCRVLRNMPEQFGVSDDDADVEGGVQPGEILTARQCTCESCQLTTMQSEQLKDFLSDQRKWKLALVQLNITYFGPSLGLSAFTGMWRSLNISFEWLNIPIEISWVLWFLTLVVFTLTAVMYGVRSFLSFELLKRDFGCNRLVNFFFAPLIVATGLALSAPDFLRHPTVSLVVFYVLLVYQFGLSLYVHGDWLFGRKFSLKWVSPSQQISIIGNFLVASYGASLGQVEEAKLMFSVGLLFWVIIVVALFIRLSESFRSMHEEPNPTLVMFIAPPAAASVSWFMINIATGVEKPYDQIVTFFYFIDFYLYLMVSRLAKSFVNQPFAVAFWAVIFPSSTAASASITVAFGMESIFWRTIAVGFVLAACAFMVYVATMTIVNLVRGNFVQDAAALDTYAVNRLSISASVASDSITPAEDRCGARKTSDEDDLW